MISLFWLIVPGATFMLAAFAATKLASDERAGQTQGMSRQGIKVRA